MLHSLEQQQHKNCVTRRQKKELTSAIKPYFQNFATLQAWTWQNTQICMLVQAFCPSSCTEVRVMKLGPQSLPKNNCMHSYCYNNVIT